MKKLFTILLLSTALVFGFEANAQYCGAAHAVCGLPRGYYGFGSLDSIPCITQGTSTSILVPFKCYNQFTAQGNHVTIKKLRIDTITNLPCGLCWSTNSPTNEFYADNDGCFLIQGLTNDAVGEYKMHLVLSVSTADTSIYDIQHINANAGGVYLYFRVKAAAGACAAVDTSQLGLTATTGCPSGVKEIANAVSELTIQPNPMSAEAKVVFTSEVNGDEQIRIINIVGSEVYHATINAKAGINETTISRNNLPAGIYILSVGNGNGMTSRKFIISE